MIQHRRAHSRPRLGAIALATAFASLSMPVRAVDYVWQAGDGLWTDSAKWSLLGVPGADDSATINNTGTGRVLLNDSVNLGRLTLNAGAALGGTGSLNIGRLVFNGGKLGTNFQGPGATATVSGGATFDGTGTQSLDYSQTLNLQGSSTWTAGNGWLAVAGAYQTGNTTYPSAVLRVSQGASFNDLGAASATGYKVLGGGNGNVLNDGIYIRSGVGTTWVRGLNNTGTVNINSGTLGFDTGNWLNYSSGQINVAPGAELLLAATTFTAGAVNNAGKVTVIGNTSTVQAGASISGIWQMNAGQLVIQGQQQMSALTFNGGTISGQGQLTVGQLSFNSGTLSSGPFLTGAVMNVQGATTFNGTDNQSLLWSHRLNLNGNSTWTAGNGRLSVDSAYSSGNSSYPSAVLHIAQGTTFSDLGAASANGFKVLGGGNGNVLNDGTYTRSGVGTTWVRGLNNTGTLNVNSGALGLDTGNWLNYSSGQINVASGAELLLAATTLSAGAINNAGKVTVIGNTSTVQAGASISGIWQMNAGQLVIQGQQQMSALTVNGGTISGQGQLTVGQLNFNSGMLSTGPFLTGGVMNVQGTTTFNGTDNQSLLWSYRLNLNGNSTWTAGNGRLSVDSAYSSGSTSYPSAVLHIAQGTTFSDLGAASATGFKVLGGGQVNNAGTYLRTGLGETDVRGLRNSGLVDIQSGALWADTAFSNTGTVNVAAGTVLGGLTGGLTNAGLLQGSGTVKLYNANAALSNTGTLSPATAGTLGTLTVDGDLTLGASSVLRIDLGPGTASDRVAITDDILVGGELSVWVTPGTSLALGDTFTIATFDQRLSAATFNQISWHGLSPEQFEVSYGPHSITLSVTAVPEPATWALWAAGLAAVPAWRRRASPRRTA